ncbi:hypothetical protein ACGLWX_08525 [Halomonas sp. HMF6819]|uniref:hypothetical protein n=1 Tax=Halomonas sp. HMF6819 TaxID=3373085 RepID=UPI0037A62F88
MMKSAVRAASVGWVALWGALALPVSADDVPHLDIKTDCRETNEYSEHDVYESCLEQEKIAYQLLREAWDRIYPPVVDWCMGNMQHDGWESYQSLYECINSEQEGVLVQWPF